ncbi:MAG: AAC(3) family N-acetyltransferase [Pseudomonadota bacterium]
MTTHLVYQNALRQTLVSYSGKPVIVHSDLFRAACFVPPAIDRQQLLSHHRDFLDSLGVRLQIPAFNYQFPRTRSVDLRTASTELGPLGDFMRDQWATARTFDPVFSFLLQQETAPVNLDDGLYTAFGPQSRFPYVVAEGGAIVMYGAALSSLTMLHHAEVVSGGPLYRYDKEFYGRVTDWQARESQVRFRYHVRPQGVHLDYDWSRIQLLLAERQVLRWIQDERKVLGFVLDAQQLVDTLVAALKTDPLWLLDAQSREWVEPKLQKLGRRFVLADFEPTL